MRYLLRYQRSEPAANYLSGVPHTTPLPYAATGAFSHTVLHYLDADPSLQPFYSFAADRAGLAAAMEARASFKTDRATLVEVLRGQYAMMPEEAAVTENIERLADEKTFTICTAHQPNLCTGYLYFVYKILHAVKLAETLNKDFPDRHFVPVYYMGSEDADLDELGTFRYGDRKFVWDAEGQAGAVGHMYTCSLKPLLDELFSIMGPPGEHYDALKEMLSKAYLEHDTIAAATQYLAHALFGRYGLVVLNPDHARLKRNFARVMEDDLDRHSAEIVVKETIERLAGSGFRAQAHPRSINLFYLRDDVRQRIEKTGENEWRVADTDIRFSKAALVEELQAHPERFSPNVILRPLYQETILPNIAFIGGGAEVAYWLQLKDLFGHYQVFFPAIILRQSFLWIDKTAAALRSKTGISIDSLFEEEHELISRLAREAGNIDFTSQSEALQNLTDGLSEKAVSIDRTLGKSAAAILAKMRYQLAILEKKMVRAQKRKMEVDTGRISRLKGLLFPNGGLQERTENFIPFYLLYGPSFFDILLAAIPPSYEHQFAVIEA